MLWNQKRPKPTAGLMTLPVGSITIAHAETGRIVAVVLPQEQSGATQQVANLLERAPEVIRTARALDLLIQTKAAEISIANALRDLRKAMAGIDLED